MPIRSIPAVLLPVLFLCSTLAIDTPALHAQSTGVDTGTWAPEVRQDTLPNGLRVLFTRVNSIPLAEVSILVDAGTDREQTGQHGIAHLTAKMLMKGSADRDQEMIARRMDQLGSYATGYTHYDYAQLYGKMLRRNFRSTLEIMADAVVRPTFPAVEIDRYRQEASKTMLRMPSSAGEKASAHAIGLVCGSDHALTRPLQPEPADFESLTRQDLQAFHGRWYRPERCTVIISGDLDYGFVRTLLLEVFGRWERGTESRETSVPPVTEAGGIVLLSDTTVSKGLAYVRIAIPALRRDNAAMPALVLLNSILGESDSSLLRLALWGEKLLSPSFTSALGFSPECGYLMLSGSISPPLTDDVIAIIDALLDTLAENGVSAARLERAKARLLVDSPLTFASNRNLLGLLKEVAVYGLDMAEVLRFSDLIREVGTEDLRRLAAELLVRTRRHTVVLGDGEKLLPELRATGREVVVISGSQD